MENQKQPTIQPQMPVQPVPQPTQSTIEQPIKVKKSLPKSPLIIAGVILLAVLLTGTYMLGKNQNTSQKPASKTAQAITPTAAITTPTSNTADATANWKTYTDTRYSVKYPTAWFTYVYPNGMSIGNSVAFSDIPNPQDIPLKVSTTNHSLVQISYISQQMPSCFPYDNGGTECVNSTIKPFSINGYSGMRGQQESVLGLNEVVYLANTKGGYFAILNQIGNIDNFNLMLSTFKISGQANSSPTEIVNSFYNSYLTCVNKHFQSQSTKSAKEDCPFNSYSALSPDLIAKLNVPGFADPVLCAQNTPTSISVDTATINDNTATTTVHELFTGSGDNPIEIALSNQNSNWLITTITCAKP